MEYEHFFQTAHVEWSFLISALLKIWTGKVSVVRGWAVTHIGGWLATHLASIHQDHILSPTGDNQTCLQTQPRVPPKGDHQLRSPGVEPSLPFLTTA